MPRSGFRTAAVAGCLLLVCLSACSPSKANTSAPATAPPVSQSPSPAGHTADLASYLLPVPAGAQPAHTFPTASGTAALPGDGRLTLSEAIVLSINPHESDALTSTIYRGGVVRSWTKGGSQVVLELLQLDSAENAGIFFRYDSIAIRNQFQAQDQHDVPGLAGAVTLLVPKTDKYAHGFYRSYSYAEVDDVVIAVITVSRTFTGDPAAANALLQQQVDRL